MPPNETAPSFTDEDRNRLNEITLGRGPVVGDPPRIARALAYIDHLEGAVEAADELANRASVRTLARDYLRTRASAALPTSKED